MQNSITPLVLSLLTLFAAGCTATVTEDDLYESAETARTQTLGQIWYLGRRDGYDYFQISQSRNKVRLCVPNSIIHEPQSLQHPPRDMNIHAGGLIIKPFPAIPFPSIPQ